MQTWRPGLLIAAVMFAGTVHAAQPNLKLPGSDWKLVGDNSASIKAWHEKKGEAKHLLEYADKLLMDSPHIAEIQRNGGGPAVVAHSREINMTASELGKLGPVFTGPFNYCVAAGPYLQQLWFDMLAGHSVESMKAMRSAYQSSHDACANQIKNPPELTYEIVGPNTPEANLFGPNAPKTAICPTIFPSDGEKTITMHCTASVLRKAGLLETQ